VAQLKSVTEAALVTVTAIVDVGPSPDAAANALREQRPALTLLH
jgi:hypothetical protein